MEKKFENSNISLKLFDESKTKIHTEELAHIFKCDDGEFEVLSYKILKNNKGKQHKIEG